MNQWGTKEEIENRHKKVISLYKKGKPIKEIKKETGYGKSGIYEILKEYKIKKCRVSRGHPKYDYNRIRNLYLNGNRYKKYLTYREICQIVGCTGNVILKAIENLNPKLRRRNKR
jgi:transposase